MVFAAAWRLERARRAAVDVISPMVALSRERLGAIPAAAWRQPYLIGFLSMLISLIARSETGNRISSEHLGIVQRDAWRAISGFPDDRIGEEICLLSAEADGDFIGGCINAARFFDAFGGRHDPADPEIGELCAGAFQSPTYCAPCLDGSAQTPVFGRGGYVAAALWSRYFEECLR